MRRAGQPPAPPRRIVILGAARSGTKVLRDALATATGAGAVPYDIGYVWRYGNEDRRDDVLDPALLDDRARAFIRGFVDRYADGDPPTVIEKTVGNCLRLPAVAAVLPEAGFVHLIRDGVDATESIRRQWTEPTDLRYLLRKGRHFPVRLAPRYGARYLGSIVRQRVDRDHRLASWGPRYPGIDDDLRRKDLLVVAARQWRESVTRVRSDADRIGLPLVEVRYERLVGDPERELTDLADRLRVPLRPVGLRRACAMLTPRHLGTGQRNLPRADLVAIDTEIGDLLERLGYRRPAAVRALGGSGMGSRHADGH
ncbi:sulfotransferase [Solwaraspora sp. WMMD1047]|uniref:sulfotransferase n=1 Tax=Solwaraspora sp. WMMD1047 TaxID=3016102 RepID=UPI002417AFF7|nr:sulfotransferase [Solwaraspora sp. WMMD1047]MDG4831443.1 sulfotransferase [Solwaraspora sp. WMMD1047]